MQEALAAESVQPTNAVAVRAYGLMRTGNHAILTWLQGQFAGQPTCYLNNVRHGDCDPYTNFADRLLTDIDEAIDAEQLRALPKQLLIYSYEDEERWIEGDSFLDSVFDARFEANRERYLQTSGATFDLAVVRDPFNFFASRLKKRNGLPGVKDVDWIVHNWKLMAREALALQEHPQPGKVVANYNAWTTDRQYRKQLSRQLRGRFDDRPKAAIPEFGGGSSFDKFAHKRLTVGSVLAAWQKLLDPRRYTRLGHYWQRLTAPPPQEMKVLERWKLLSDRPRYRRIFADPEILELSEALFGEIPGTRAFVRTST